MATVISLAQVTIGLRRGPYSFLLDFRLREELLRNAPLAVDGVLLRYANALPIAERSYYGPWKRFINIRSAVAPNRGLVSILRPTQSSSEAATTPASSSNFATLAKSVAGLSFSRGLAQGIALLSLPVITSLFAPSTVGAAAIVIGTTTIIASGGAAGYQLAVPLPISSEDAELLGKVSFALVLTGTIILSVVMLAIATVFDGAGIKTAHVPFYSVLFLIQALTAVQLQSCIRNRSFAAISKAVTYHAVTAHACIIIAGFVRPTSVSYLIGHTIGHTVELFVLLYASHFRYAGFFNRGSFPSAKALMRRYRRFPQITWPTLTMNAAGSNIPVLSLGWFFGSSAAGLFVMGQRLALAPVRLLGQSIAQVYAAEMAKARRTDPSSIIAVFRKGIIISSGPALLAAIALYVLGPTAVRHLLPESWNDVAVLLHPLAVLTFFRLLASSVGRVFTILERQYVAFWWNLTRLSLTVLCFAAGSALQLSIAQAVFVFAMTWAVIDAAVVILAWRVARTESQKRSEPNSNVL